MAITSCSRPPPLDPRCTVDLDCGDGARCVDGDCVDEAPLRLCSDDSGCPQGEVCTNGVCAAAPPPVTGCRQTADCPIDEFCNTSQGTCQDLLPGWCRRADQCNAAAPLCSNRDQGEGVPGSCVACITSADCTGGEDCLGGLCLGATDCPLNSSPTPAGGCVCDEGYLADENGRCYRVGDDPGRCPPLSLTCRDLGFDAGTITRSADCEIVDITDCHDVCGNGRVGVTEQCDGSQIPLACTDLGFLDGPLTCIAGTCRVNASQCVSPVCGDGIVEGSEVCEPDDLVGATCTDFGFTRGELACARGCRDYDQRGCIFGDEVEPNNTAATANPQQERFVGRIDPAGDTDCMQVNLAVNDVMTAAVIGLSSESLGSCSGDPTLTFFSPRGVQLAFNDDSNGLCPALTRTATEAGAHALCVRALSSTATIASYRLRTTVRTPFCGDNVRDAGETCDGADLAGRTCSAEGGIGGTLSCRADCRGYDTSACTFPVCGDGRVQGAEVCDGSAGLGSDCIARGFTEGTVTCAADCRSVITSDCRKVLDEVEPNGSPGSANPYVPAFRGEISPAGDRDCVAIAAAAGQTIDAAVVDRRTGALSTCGADTTMRLFGPNGAELAFNDDANGLCSQIVRTIASTGPHTICVQGYSSSATFLYRLDITLR
jgi:hypothetical protein